MRHRVGPEEVATQERAQRNGAQAGGASGEERPPTQGLLDFGFEIQRIHFILRSKVAWRRRACMFAVNFVITCLLFLELRARQPPISDWKKARRNRQVSRLLPCNATVSSDRRSKWFGQPDQSR